MLLKDLGGTKIMTESHTPHQNGIPSPCEYIGSGAVLVPREGPEIPLSITDRNCALFIYSGVHQRFEAIKQGTGYIVPMLESFTGQYTQFDEPRKSRALSMFMKDGSFHEFFALQVRIDSKISNGGAHHHVVDIEKFSGHREVLETIDVNKIHALSGALTPVTWQGDQV